MNRFIWVMSVLFAGALACSAQAEIRIIRGGSLFGTYTRMSDAATASRSNDLIEITSDYSGTAAVALFVNAYSVYRDNLTIRGITKADGTRPVLDGQWKGVLPEDKAILVLRCNNATVENLEFTNAYSVNSGNGCGIRGEGQTAGETLTIRDCYFHDSQGGVMAGRATYFDQNVIVENCEFAYNGYGGDNSQSHQIYIGVVTNSTIRYCYFHHSYMSQEVKSRGYKNYVLYNRITCEEDGRSNYEVDFPQGGETYLIGNVIHQGRLTTNKTIVSYKAESYTNPDLHLYVINNTIVNSSTDAVNSIFVRVGWTDPTKYVTTPAVIKNNIFQGIANHPIVQYFSSTPTYTDANWTNNWHTGSGSAYLAWEFQYDYRPTSSSTGAINLGVAPGTSDTGYSLTPTLQYVHPCTYQTRPTNGTIDIGCYEYVSNPTNQYPYVEAGLNQITTLPRYTVDLNATVSDDGLGGTLTTVWSKLSGPGTVTFGNSSAVDTTATFNLAGIYVLKLAAFESGVERASDTVTITVNPDPALGGTMTFQNGVTPDVTYAGCEDNFIKEDYPGTHYGLYTTGIILGEYAGTNRGLIKFDISAIPSTATVTSANLRVHMQAVTANRTLEAYQILPARPWTRSGSSWNDYATSLPWTTAGCGAAGTDRAAAACGSLAITTSQSRTWVDVPLTTSLVQGWVNGTITNNGLLTKVTDETVGYLTFTCENYVDRRWAITNRPQLVVDFTPPNAAPTVNAGNDQAITLPAAATLDGTVSDDNLPNPPAACTVTWSKVSGPGTVTFGNANAVDTTATFSVDGTYVLQLLANDSALQTTDTVTVTVNPEPAEGLTVLGSFSTNSLKPATNSYTGAGIAFIPAYEDSISQDTLVINWRILDSGSNYNQVFQRITIPGDGGTPTLLATATIRWDMLYDGTNQFGSGAPTELVFEAATNRLIVVRSPADGGNRFFWFNLFNTDTAISSVGYSAKNGDNTTVMGKAIISSAGGVYTSFYPYSTNWVKAAMDIDDGNGAAITKTNIAKSAFTGWWPDTSAAAYAVDGFNCEGGASYGSNVLLIRNYKDSTQGDAQESHLYLVGSALDAAALNSAVDLGNMIETTGSFANLLAYGITLDGSSAYVRYGYINDAGAYNRILMLQVGDAGSTLLVDFGATSGENQFGLAGWTTVMKDAYTNYGAYGPGGTTIVTGNNGAYNYQGVQGSAYGFAEGNVISVTWYNNSATERTFTPMISFEDPDRRIMGPGTGAWYSMTQVTVPAYGTAASTFTFGSAEAGTYSLVNTNVNYDNTGVIVCDKIELE